MKQSCNFSWGDEKHSKIEHNHKCMLSVSHEGYNCHICSCGMEF